jgi:flagellar hook-associated protein 2
MSTNGVQGTNVPPISFPGIVSGIDWNSIISEETSLSMEPTKALNASIATLNNANVELTKIDNLLISVQTSLQDLSDPKLFATFDADSSNLAAADAEGVAGTPATPGVYTIDSVKTATSTVVTNSATAGHAITDPLTSGTYAGQASDTVPLVDSYAAVTPTNGTGAQGQVTVDGVAIDYNVDSQSLDQILNNITTQVDASADHGFLATLVNGVVEFTSSDKQISIGSSADQGNLLDVLRLSNAQVLNSSSSGSITGTGNVGGINPTEDFNSTNDAGFSTAVTAGFFTINGVKISVQADQNLGDVINEINSGDAGVTAAYDASTGNITLTATQTGPQSIVLGASGDTSNFLSAAGLTSSSGASTQVGTQAVVDLQTASGGVQQYYSNSNTVTSAIPGIQLTLQGNTSTPFSVTVTQNTTQLVSAITTFVSAYNAAISEINSATAAPIVTPVTPGSNAVAQSVGGGVLFGNDNIQSVASEMEDIVSGFLGTGTTYNSLSQIGLKLNSTFTAYTTSNNTGTDTETSSSSSEVQSTTYQGTDGTLQSLNVSSLVSALEADPSQVQSLITGAQSLTTQLGSYITGVTGSPTLLSSGTVGTLPATSVILNYENKNNDSIQTFQQQVQQITNTANAQANALRAQFVASETAIAGLQAEQQELASALGFTVTSSSSASSSSSG